MICSRFFSLMLAALTLLWPLTSAAAEVNPQQIDQTVNKALAFLDLALRNGPNSGEASLAAYALLKGGRTPKDPAVARIVASVEQKIQSGEYLPQRHHFYEACVDLLLLEAADPEKFRESMRPIVEYIIQGQSAEGAWYYPDRLEDAESKGGDTSITQYALLGLWAGQRVGIDIPLSVWDRAAEWHLRTQQANGAFGYHPAGQKTPVHSMTAAGTGSLYVCRMHLYPNVKGPRSQEPQQPKSHLKFGILQPVDLDVPEENDRRLPAHQNVQSKPKASLSAIDKACLSGQDWLREHFTFEQVPNFPLYYIYGLERMASLANIKSLGEHDWYKEGAEYLIKNQQSNGTWVGDNSGAVPSACFGVLFLVRATGKLLNRPIAPRQSIGQGLLIGGRGLPENLGEVKVHDGIVEQQKITGPLDQLLSTLANPRSDEVEGVQQAIIEKIQLGNREELIGQKDLLVKLVRHPQVEVRRTACWALGRCDDLTLAPVLIQALKDPDFSVVVEARNALCLLGRKPAGFGHGSDPLAALPEKATEEQKQAAITSWRNQVHTDWTAWYFQVRPYEERDDLEEFTRRKP